jgi:mRNA interferase MazF
VVEAPGAYVPERGDAVWINLHPQAGHEQGGRRPAVVLSPSAYNGRVGLALLCPITNQRKGYPFEVHIPSRLRLTGLAGAPSGVYLRVTSRDCGRGAGEARNPLGRTGLTRA